MNKTIGIVIGVILIGIGSFYAGQKYALSKNMTGTGANRNFSGGIGQQGSQRGVRGGMGGFVAGAIISKDDKSITIKLRDGGSKIVFMSTSTPVTKSTAGSANDLQIDTDVMVVGKTNSDGSVSAESIQIRPQLINN